ncbi:hypothetical protein [Herbaspirillum sp. RV1423]|uniref:hypothetical protein n=1 Tax=Herbaspirillum sp. RV1423 TaxID=1443993 RepID=UPI00055864EC|nr:hypothetical protein [Herbaspirillum sp. RV1423]
MMQSLLVLAVLAEAAAKLIKLAELNVTPSYSFGSGNCRAVLLNFSAAAETKTRAGMRIRRHQTIVQT